MKNVNNLYKINITFMVLFNFVHFFVNIQRGECVGLFMVWVLSTNWLIISITWSKPEIGYKFIFLSSHTVINITHYLYVSISVRLKIVTDRLLCW